MSSCREMLSNTSMHLVESGCPQRPDVPKMRRRRPYAVKLLSETCADDAHDALWLWLIGVDRLEQQALCMLSAVT